MPRRPRTHRSAFIILFGSRNIVSSDSAPPVQTVCPNCGQHSTIVGKHYRTWFTLFFIPIFPMSGAHPLTQCTTCGAQFGLTLDDLRRGIARAESRQNEEAIGLYNSLRSSPANSITLNQLMQTYAGMKEYDQAISAAREFPEALNASEQCMTTLGRVFLAADRHGEAVQWFDAALARNATLGEAHYYKAVAMLTSNPPNYAGATAAARAARNAGYANAEALLREAEAKARGE
jgi:predicted Zn-dependent protease